MAEFIISWSLTMHRMDSVDPQKSKAFFKKRAHRPWNAALLENTIEEATTPKMPINHTANRVDEELQETLIEKTKQRNELSELLTSPDENRLLIGGFLHPQNIFFQPEAGKLNESSNLIDELKNKEQEILTLSSDLKVAKAMEQVEKLELSRKKEEEARMAAESKALFAIREAKLAAEQAYKIEQQLNNEKQMRLKEEKSKRLLEEKNLAALNEIAKNEALLLKYEQAQLAAAEKIKQIEANAVLQQQRVKNDAEDKIKKIVDEMCLQIEKHKKICSDTNLEAAEAIAEMEKAADLRLKEVELNAEQRIKLFEKQAEEKIARIQADSNRKIQEALRQIQSHEKAKQSVQTWAQKTVETARQAEVAKKEMEEKLTALTKTAEDNRLQFQTKIDNMASEITQLNKQNENMKIQNEELLIKSQAVEQKNVDIINELETIQATADNERVKFEIKTTTLLSETHQLKEQKSSLEQQKNKLETQLAEANSSIQALKNVIETERNLRKILEQKLDGSTIRVDEQKRKLVENKILELTKQMGDMEVVRFKLEETLAETAEQLNKLRIQMKSEKIVKESLEVQLKESMEKVFNLEILKQKEYDAKLAAEQQIMVLLGQRQYLEKDQILSSEKLTAMLNRTKELEMDYGNEKSLRISAEKDISILQSQLQQYIAEKVQYEQKIDALFERTRELEVMLNSEIYLRKEAERLKSIEEQAKKSAQEKISHAIEQANQMVLNALGGLTTVDVPTGEI